MLCKIVVSWETFFKENILVAEEGRRPGVPVVSQFSNPIHVIVLFHANSRSRGRTYWVHVILIIFYSDYTSTGTGRPLSHLT